MDEKGLQALKDDMSVGLYAEVHPQRWRDLMTAYEEAEARAQALTKELEAIKGTYLGEVMQLMEQWQQRAQAAEERLEKAERIVFRIERYGSDHRFTLLDDQTIMLAKAYVADREAEEPTE